MPRVRNFDDARSQAQHRFRAFFHAMLDARGVPAAECVRGVVRRAAHDEEALDRIASALPAAARAAAAAEPDQAPAPKADPKADPTAAGSRPDSAGAS